MVASIFASQQWGGSTPVYSPEATALFARMSVQPDAARKTLINDCIVGLIADGVWTDLEVLQVYAAHDSQAGRLNWISSSYTATAISSPSFTIDRGYAGDGSTSYINTNWAPSGSSLYTLNSGTLGAYINAGPDGAANNRTIAGVIDGSADGALITPRGLTAIRGRINRSATDDFGSVSTNRGSTIISRTASNLTTAYRDGVSAGNTAAVSNAVPAGALPIFVGGYNANGSLANATSDRAAYFFAAAALDATKVLAVHNRLLTLLTAIGAN